MLEATKHIVKTLNWDNPFLIYLESFRQVIKACLVPTSTTTPSRTISNESIPMDYQVPPKQVNQTVSPQREISYQNQAPSTSNSKVNQVVNQNQAEIIRTTIAIVPIAYKTISMTEAAITAGTNIRTTKEKITHYLNMNENQKHHAPYRMSKHHL